MGKKRAAPASPRKGSRVSPYAHAVHELTLAPPIVSVPANMDKRSGFIRRLLVGFSKQDREHDRRLRELTHIALEAAYAQRLADELAMHHYKSRLELLRQLEESSDIISGRGR